MAERRDMKADPEERLGLFRRGGDKKKGAGRWLLHFFILLMMFLASGIGIVWYMMDGDFTTPDTGDAPLILADKEPFKVRPADPGGMEVPGQGRSVYDRLEGGGEEAPPARESLLPPPEEPLPPPSGSEKVIAEFKNDAPEAAPTEPSAGTEVPELSAAAPVETPPPPPSAPSVQTAPAPEPAPTPPSAPAPKAAAAPAPLSASVEPYLVQIASLRSAEAVTREWQRLQKAHADLLGGLKLHPQTVDLGPDKGVFHRVRAGFLDEASARALCVTLKSRNVGCLPVKAGN